MVEKIVAKVRKFTFDQLGYAQYDTGHVFNHREVINFKQRLNLQSVNEYNNQYQFIWQLLAASSQVLFVLVTFYSENMFSSRFNIEE